MEKIQPTSLPPLTGLRGIAAYSVLIAHGIDTSFYYGGVSIFHPNASRLAYFGMSLFFVLSGFVIQYNYAEIFKTDYFVSATRKFFVARFARLYPLYAFSILISLSYIPSPYFAGDLTTWLSYLTLTQSWFNREMAIFPPDWSVSTEWFFYATFVPLTFVLARIRHPIRVLVILSTVAPIALMTLFNFNDFVISALTPVMWHGDKVSAGVWGWTTYYCPYFRVLEFIAGALAAKAAMVRGDVPSRPGAGRILSVLCVAWCAAIVLVPAISELPLVDTLLSNFIFAPALALLLYSCSRHNTWLSRTLACRPLLFMGDISYSVYIWCWSILTLLAPQFLSPAASALAYFNSSVKLAAIVAVTTMIASGSYRLVEFPARQQIRSLLQLQHDRPNRLRAVRPGEQEGAVPELLR